MGSGCVADGGRGLMRVMRQLRCWQFGPVRRARGASAAHGEAASVDLPGHLCDMRISVGEHVCEHVNVGL